MSTHTPGPWVAIAKLNPDPSEGTHWIGCSFGAFGYWRGHKSHHDDSKWILNEADSRLIAAAPDLLMALEACIERCSLDDDPWVRAKVIDAIAKATGETA